MPKKRKRAPRLPAGLKRTENCPIDGSVMNRVRVRKDLVLYLCDKAEIGLHFNPCFVWLPVKVKK